MHGSTCHQLLVLAAHPCASQQPVILCYPKLSLQFALQVAGRMLKYSYYIARVSHFIASKMQSAVTKNMVFPSCTDIPLPPLLALDHRFAAAAIPAFLATGTLIAWPNRCLQKRQQLAPHEQPAPEQATHVPLCTADVLKGTGLRLLVSFFGFSKAVSFPPPLPPPAPHSLACLKSEGGRPLSEIRCAHYTLTLRPCKCIYSAGQLKGVTVWNCVQALRRMLLMTQLKTVTSRSAACQCSSQQV